MRRARGTDSRRQRADLLKKLKPLEIKECPFANLPAKKGG
jgi:hypothetical protein